MAVHVPRKFDMETERCSGAMDWLGAAATKVATVSVAHTKSLITSPLLSRLGMKSPDESQETLPFTVGSLLQGRIEDNTMIVPIVASNRTSNTLDPQW